MGGRGGRGAAAPGMRRGVLGDVGLGGCRLVGGWWVARAICALWLAFGLCLGRLVVVGLGVLTRSLVGMRFEEGGLAMPEPLDSEHPGRFSASLVAGLAILRCFSAERQVLGISDMAAALGLGRSTTHRYATTLVMLGFLEQSPSRKYRLASRVLDLGLSVLDSMVVRELARESLRELRDWTGRTVRLGVLDGSEVAYIDCRRGSRRGQYEIDAGLGVGTRLPVYCSAAGKVLLARLPAAERLDLLARLRLSRYGPNAIVSKQRLRGELERIAAEGGVAVEDEELTAGRRAVAAAVVDAEGRAVAAVELAAPVWAYARDELLEELGLKVAGVAQRISGLWVGLLSRSRANGSTSG